MKKLLLLLGLVLTTNAFSEELTLSCHGQAEVSDTSLFLDGEFGMLFGEKEKDASLTFFINETKNQGWVQLSGSLFYPERDRKKIEKYALTELKVTGSQIKAKFQINRANKPEITINRNTGSIDYISNRFPRVFSGACEEQNMSKKKTLNPN